MIHLCAWAPLAWLGWAAATNNLTVNPIQAATQRTGQLALIFLLVSLACTPLNTYLGFHQAIKLRRMIGLYAFMIATIHFSIFIGIDYRLDWNQIVDTILEKRFTLVGAGALIILTALAATSFPWWKKHLGKNWRRLHRFVYLAGYLVILHFAWARKGDIFRLTGDVTAPLIAAIGLTILMILRIPALRRAGRNLQFRLRAQRGIHLPIHRNR